MNILLGNCYMLAQQSSFLVMCGNSSFEKCDLHVNSEHVFEREN